MYKISTYSHSGVLKTRSVPYFLLSPAEHLNTPPNLTSSPKRHAVGSEPSITSRAFAIEFVVFRRSRYFIWGISLANWYLYVEKHAKSFENDLCYTYK